MTPVSQLIGDPAVRAELDRKASLLERATAGKLVVEFNLKDGRWKLGNVSVTFPRRHSGAERG